MALTSKDLYAMKTPAIVFAIAIAAACAMVWFTSDQLKRSEARYRDQMAALDSAKMRYQRSGEERETVLHYIQAYKQLEQLGVVGSEQRLNWVESLRQANVQAGLFGVDYQMSAQAPYELARKDHPLAERVKQSQMKLFFGVLHEGDLMRLLDALSAQQAGLYTLSECTLDRAGRQGAPQPKQPNLTAECELSWVTIESDRKRPR